MKRPTTVALALLALSVPAFAQDDPAPDCENAVTQSDMNICAGAEFDAADKALNAAYQRTMNRARSTDKELGESQPAYAGAAEALKRAQRAWIGYRDGQCELAGFAARGGSMEPMLVSGCLADLTRKRTQELNEVLEAE